MNTRSFTPMAADGRSVRGRSAVAAPLSFVALVCLVLLVLAAVHEWMTRADVLRDAAKDAANLARSLTQHADDTFEMTDAALIGIVERLETRGQAPEELDRLSRFMALRVTTLPRIRGLFVYDKTGGWIASSLPSLPVGFNNSDRSYFQHHLRSPERSSFLGTPILSRSDGEWIVTLSRRYDAPDGSFAGVVLATLDASYFFEHYAHFNVGPHGAIALMHRDGTVMARYPDGPATVGRNLSRGPLFQEALPNAPSGILRYVSPVDGRERISGYRSSSRLPVVLLVALDVEDALAPWRSDALWRFGAILVLVGLIASVGWWSVRQADLRQCAEVARLESETNFRLLAEHSGDMVSRIGPDGHRTYVSPASLKIIGRRPDELVGRNVLEDVHPDDQAELERTVEALKRGQVGEIIVTYRHRHRDGREIWLESSVHVSLNPRSGEPDGVVATSRDISDRKALEDALRSMAATDGLTGLANRRRFDEALAAGRSYAMGRGSPLALLMIDVDNFKGFNDHYGHQAGDDCLKKVAAAIARKVQVNGAVIARYGGEEMAVLLPSTKLQAACELAEEVRQAVEDLRLEHARNTASSWVTVSIGVGCRSFAVSERDDEVEADLVMVADAALYAAKDNGRNQIMPPMTEESGTRDRFRTPRIVASRVCIVS